MREIKFRVWSDFYEKYADFDAELFMDGSVEADFTDGTGIPHHETTDLVVEQYTGLKDKNGKEIHIGDIVSEHQGDIIGEIVQNPSGEYRIAWLGIYGGYSELYAHHSLCEVIGNIHENPELLERRKNERRNNETRH